MKGGGRCICHGISNIVYIKTKCIQKFTNQALSSTHALSENKILSTGLMTKKIVWLTYRNIEQLEIESKVL